MRPQAKFTLFCGRCRMAVTSYTFTRAQAPAAIATHAAYCGCKATDVTMHRSR